MSVVLYKYKFNITTTHNIVLFLFLNVTMCDMYNIHYTYTICVPIIAFLS